MEDLRLEGPEVREGVGRNLFPVHHLAGTPDVILAGEVELGNDGAVHLGVVAHKDAGLVRDVFDALKDRLAVEKADDRADQKIEYVLFFARLRHVFTTF